MLLAGVTENYVVELVGVSYCKDLNKLIQNNAAFISYDTKIFSPDDQHYPLRMKEAIVLTFFSPHNDACFTTIRRYTKEKFDYYQSLIGDSFIITMV